MISSKPPEAVASLLGRLMKRHKKLLKSGEVFLAACDTFAAVDPHPEPMTSGRRKQPVLPLPSEERLQLLAAARFRLTSVQAALGMQDTEFAELPASANGYMLTHTDRRMLIFDGSGKTYQLQAPLKGMWLQAVDHGDNMYTLVFNNGEERVAVATRRESVELTRYFIDSFPDRRQQARVLPVTNDPSIVEF